MRLNSSGGVQFRLKSEHLFRRSDETLGSSAYDVGQVMP
jgi:hypothetical protein